MTNETIVALTRERDALAAEIRELRHFRPALDGANKLVKSYREENESLRARVKELENMLLERGAMVEPPCFICGYNGEGYYQATKHPCALRHHAALTTPGEKP